MWEFTEFLYTSGRLKEKVSEGNGYQYIKAVEDVFELDEIEKFLIRREEVKDE